MRFLFLVFMLLPLMSYTQNLPEEVRITPEGRLISGGNPTEGLYNPEVVNKMEITLTQSNWFQLMDGMGGGPNATPGISLMGTLTYNDDVVLDSVLVSIKGQTSDFQNNSEKKSFKIEIDELKEQDLLGYDNLNLNGGFQDRAGMREVLYYDVSRSFTPSLKGALVDLYINGQYWGPYNNIQQVEGTYIKEWFTDNEGTRWRAKKPDEFSGGGPGGGLGGPFGTGYASLNYNGPDSIHYNEFYTLKKTEKEDPWQDLIDICLIIDTEPIADMYDLLNDRFDIDRALWILAQENIFGDDDSYVYKGGMDYYVYWDNETKRLMPLEVDGNSVMIGDHATWSPFYNENDPDYPLLNRVMQNQAIRQRYLAHYRTILEDYFVEDAIHNRIDEFAAKLDQRVQDDPKKIYSYNEFLVGVQDLKAFVTERRNFVSSHFEVNRTGLAISDLQIESDSGVGVHPVANEEVEVRVSVEGDSEKVLLYYGLGLDGVYDRVEMFDDGMSNDGAAGDNVYGAPIPGFEAGNYVRYYVEAVQNDGFSTATYFPKGAEHDVFIYRVALPSSSPGDVVLNEFMASNESTTADNAGEYDDWIELYNVSSQPVDLTGYALSDNEGNITKWFFPDGTTIQPDAYLIVWADDDEDQSSANELHANFKLSSDGETLILVNASGNIIDAFEFGAQVSDVSMARIPNGIGDFEFRTETFNANNDGSMTDTENPLSNVELKLFPNPTSSFVSLQIKGMYEQSLRYELMDGIGKKVQSGKLNGDAHFQTLDVSNLQNGLYYVSLMDEFNNRSQTIKLTILE